MSVLNRRRQMSRASEGIDSGLLRQNWLLESDASNAESSVRRNGFQEISVFLSEHRPIWRMPRVQREQCSKAMPNRQSEVPPGTKGGQVLRHGNPDVLNTTNATGARLAWRKGHNICRLCKRDTECFPYRLQTTHRLRCT